MKIHNETVFCSACMDSTLQDGFQIIAGSNTLSLCKHHFLELKQAVLNWDTGLQAPYIPNIWSLSALEEMIFYELTENNGSMDISEITEAVSHDFRSYPQKLVYNTIHRMQERSESVIVAAGRLYHPAVTREVYLNHMLKQVTQFLPSATRDRVRTICGQPASFHKMSTLSSHEEEIMLEIWRSGAPVTGLAIRKALPDTAYDGSVVYTYLYRLEKKGYIRRLESVRTSGYVPIISATDYVQNRVHRLAKIWTHGDLDRLLSYISQN